MRKRSARVLLIVSLVAIGVSFIGCATRRQVSFAMRYMLTKPEADYDAIDQARTAKPEAAENNTPRLNHTPYWTSYRGPNISGKYDEQSLNLDWGEAGPTEIWRAPVGAGFGSFVVAEGIAFTLEQRRDEEGVIACDLRDGREVWSHTYRARFYEAMSGEGPRGTPAYHNGNVYTLGSLGDVHCLRAATGDVIWKRNVLDEAQAKNLEYGLAASPVIIDGNVLVLAGESATGNTLQAFDAETGTPTWSSLSEKLAYSTPMPVKLAGMDQLILTTGSRTIGIGRSGGDVLWSFPWQIMGDLSSCQPVPVDGAHFVLSGGYGKGTSLVAVSRNDTGRFDAREVWHSRRLNANFSTPIVYEGHAYGLDGGIMVCINLADGKRVWKAGRFGFGHTLLIGDRILVSGEKGRLLVVKATPEKLVVESEVQALEGKTLNTPAIAHGYLLHRNSREMVCYDLNP